MLENEIIKCTQSPYIQPLGTALHLAAVSYTHLDVYKRQAVHLAAAAGYDTILSMLLQVDRHLVDSQVYVDNSVASTETDTYDSWSHDHDSLTAKVFTTNYLYQNFCIVETSIQYTNTRFP